jgi:alpha-1,6-mannosyltransferase
VDTTQALFPTAISPLQERTYLGIVSQVLAAGYVLFYGGFALRAYLRKTYDQTQLLEDLGWITLVLLLFATAWVMPWYSSSLLAIAVMIPGRRLFGLTCLVYSVTSSAQYALQELDGLNSLIAIGLPLLVIVFYNFHWKWRSPQMSGFHGGFLLPYQKNEV